MLGGPVLPAISELRRHAEPNTNHSPPSTLKRQASQIPLPDESPAKKQSKWTPEEDNLVIELRGQGTKWDDIAKRLPGRSSISCRLRYQNYLEKRAIWDEEKKNKLARLYVRFKDQMWQKVATEMGIPWRSAESMHWQLGEQEMSARANAPVFQLHPSATGTCMSPPSQAPVVPASAPHGFTPANAPQLMPQPPPMPPQLHQVPPPMPQGPPMHYSHQRTDSGSSAGGQRRNSSFSRRRADPRSRSSIPPQLGQPLPQIQPQSEEDLISSSRTALVPGMQSITKQEGELSRQTDVYHQAKQEEDLQTHNDWNTKHGVRSIKNEPEETEQNSTVSPTVLDDAKLEPDSVSA
ncbi:hypothetical protein AA0116_g12592 [Alternaria tenuissima]|nr:hypothetical protein AA0116_g12592 [Alternaria tenuissima]